MKKFVVLCIVVMMIAIVGCVNNTSKSAVQNEQTVKTADGIKNYGNGVYYFDYTKSNFGEQLSLFIGQHPELRMVSFAPYNAGSIALPSGGTDGYFVKFEKTTSCPCDTIKK